MSTTSPAVLSSPSPAARRAVTPGTAPVAAPSDSARPPAAPPIPLVRRVSVVPGATAGPAPGAPSSSRTPSAGHDADAGPASGPSARRTAAGAPPERSGGRPQASRADGDAASRPVARPRPVGPPLTVARRTAGPVRRVAALRPTAAVPAPGTATASGASGPATQAAPAGPQTPGTAPVRRDGGRPPLGAPLTGLPPTATPPAEDASAVPAPGPVSGPALPVVQRRAEETAGAPSGSGVRATAPDTGPDGRASDPAAAPRRSGARARGGLGAPLPALPPSADLPGATASDARTPAAAHPVREQDTPAAPLLGTAGVRRSLADRSTAPGTPSPGPADPHGGGPATPLVTPGPPAASQAPAPAPQGPAGDAVRPMSASAGPGPGPVVARAVSPAAGATATGARALALLPARPLTLNTRPPEGAAPPAASRTGGRPVVAARWTTAPAGTGADHAPSTGAPTRPARPAGTRAAPPVQRAVPTHRPHDPAPRRPDPAVPAGGPAAPRDTGAVRRVPVVRPAPPRTAPGTAVAPAPERPLPVAAPRTAPPAHGPSATPAGPVPVVRPRNVTPRPAAGGGTGRAATPVQRDASPAGDLAVAKGVPVEAVPAGTGPARARSSSVSAAGDLAAPEGSAGHADRSADSPQNPGADLDDLARRLLDPLARLLRTELRRGRERTGRPYDGRR
ncbi:hypothetical protein [Streptomyces sp. XY152]|uniref:hypothetical protein n=1 Tax=Streptomyces sp. XY152 TaxID=1415560 RepID=UPI00131DD9BD|nr:hypothetical protein [Streptomyces sp. XY152]